MLTGTMLAGSVRPSAEEAMPPARLHRCCEASTWAVAFSGAKPWIQERLKTRTPASGQKVKMPVGGGRSAQPVPVGEPPLFWHQTWTEAQTT